MICKGQSLLQGCIKLFFPTNFMRWQRNCALFEKLALVSAKITFISGYCDRTRIAAIYPALTRRFLKIHLESHH